jgi:hypothetical protein
MASNLPWSILKSNALLPALFFLLFISLVVPFFFFNTAAQNTPPSQPKANAVEYTGVVSIDRLNNLYLADRQNNLRKFNAAGQLVATYSPPATGHLALIEAWNASKILLFYDDQQKIVLLDRFLAPISTVRLSDYTDGLIKTASFSGDNKLWAFDESNFSLHKIDLQFPEASRNIPLNLLLSQNQYDIRFLREYQNHVYLLDKSSGIYVFDNLGNYLKKLPFTGLSYLGFRGDELYFLAGGQVHFFHLYTLQERSVNIPSSTYLQVLAGEKSLYLITETSLTEVPLP